MSQDEAWLAKWREVVEFIEANKRNPSKFIGEERAIRNWVKHQRKLLNNGGLKTERVEKFRELLNLMEVSRHKNQYR